MMVVVILTIVVVIKVLLIIMVIGIRRNRNDGSTGKRQHAFVSTCFCADM